MASVPSSKRTQALPFAVVVGRPHDERGVAAGETDAFRAPPARRRAASTGADTKAGEGMRSFSAGAGTGALVTGVVGDREGGPA
jgi:hypothetical protein